jgi:hypothetical protein
MIRRFSNLENLFKGVVSFEMTFDLPELVMLIVMNFGAFDFIGGMESISGIESLLCK